MAQLRQDYSKFKALDTEVMIVGPEEQAYFKMYWKSHKHPFVGLSDPTHSILKRFGQEVNLFKLGRMPAQVIIDKKGIARYAHYGHSMSDIPSNEEVFKILDDINHKEFTK